MEVVDAIRCHTGRTAIQCRIVLEAAATCRCRWPVHPVWSKACRRAAWVVQVAIRPSEWVRNRLQWAWVLLEDSEQWQGWEEECQIRMECQITLAARHILGACQAWELWEAPCQTLMECRSRHNAVLVVVEVGCSLDNR